MDCRVDIPEGTMWRGLAYGGFWVYGTPAGISDRPDAIICDDGSGFSVRPETIGFTACHDADGNRIYTGDIVDTGMARGVVTWEDTGFAIVLEGVQTTGFAHDYKSTYHVRGNIYE